MMSFVLLATIDLAPLLHEILLPIASALGMVLATWLAKKVADWLNVRRDEAFIGKLEEAMKNGLALAQSRAEQQIRDKGLTVEVKSQLVADAANYAAAHVPGALKALGVGPRELAEKLEARLELNTTPPDKSVAVPTPPTKA